MLNIKSKEEFVELSKEGLLVVDFYADWCGPCRMLSPVMEELAAEFENKAKFAKLNVDNIDEVASAFRIMSIPCVVFIKDGKEVKKLVGVKSADDYADEIDAIL